MTAFGPTVAGDGAQNNTTTFSFKPSANIPAGSFVWVAGITNVADSATVTPSDGAGNTWVLQSFNQPPGSSFSIIGAWSVLTHAISTTQSIELASSARGNFAAVAVFYGGAQGFIDSYTVDFFDTVSPVLSLPSTYPNGVDTLLAMLVVGGPNTDTFTQDANFSTDVGSGIGNNNFALHGGGSQSDGLGGGAQYAPTLGTLRQSLGFLVAFR